MAGNACRSAAREWVNHRLAGAREPPDQSHHELERLRTGVNLTRALVDLGGPALKMDAVALDDPVDVAETRKVAPVK